MSLRIRIWSAAAAMLVGAGVAAAPAQAGYVVTLAEVGSNVVATGSGTINLGGLTLLGPNSYIAFIVPNNAQTITGPAGASELFDPYIGASGPSAFGSGSGVAASSGSGDVVGVYGNVGDIIVPKGYASGSPLSDTATYDGQTFSSLGVTPGTYVYSFGSGATADSFTVQIGAVPVPEPAGALLLALPLGLLMLLGARDRRAAETSSGAG